jgi:hypothetical protein
MSNYENYVPSVDNSDDTETPPSSFNALYFGLEKGLFSLHGTVCRGALCPQIDPEAFFPEKGGSNADAKEMCARCEVIPECLRLAIENGEKFGVWGGKSAWERRNKISGRWEEAQKQGMTWREFYETLSSDVGFPFLEQSSARVRRSVRPIICATIKELGGYDEQLSPEQMAFSASALYALYRSAVENQAIDNVRSVRMFSEREFQDCAEEYFCSEEFDQTHKEAVRRLLVDDTTRQSYLSRLRTILGENSEEILRQVVRDSIENADSTELSIPHPVSESVDQRPDSLTAGNPRDVVGF